MGGGAGEGKGEKGGWPTAVFPARGHPGCCWLQPAGGEDEASLSCPLLAGLAWGGAGPPHSTVCRGPHRDLGRHHEHRHADEHAGGPLG